MTVGWYEKANIFWGPSYVSWRESVWNGESALLVCTLSSLPIAG